MAERFWDLSELGLMFLQSFENPATEANELDDVGSDADCGQSFRHLNAIGLKVRVLCTGDSGICAASLRLWELSDYPGSWQQQRHNDGNGQDRRPKIEASEHERAIGATNGPTMTLSMLIDHMGL